MRNSLNKKNTLIFTQLIHCTTQFRTYRTQLKSKFRNVHTHAYTERGKNFIFYNKCKLKLKIFQNCINNVQIKLKKSILVIH